jgi:hypothetical protein
MTGVKSPCLPLQQAWGRAADHYATHDGTIRTICAYTEYGTSAPNHYSPDQGEIVPHFPPEASALYVKPKLQGPILHAGYRTRYDGARRYNTER